MYGERPPLPFPVSVGVPSDQCLSIGVPPKLRAVSPLAAAGSFASLVYASPRLAISDSAKHETCGSLLDMLSYLNLEYPNISTGLQSQLKSLPQLSLCTVKCMRCAPNHTFLIFTFLLFKPPAWTPATDTLASIPLVCIFQLDIKAIRQDPISTIRSDGLITSATK